MLVLQALNLLVQLFVFLFDRVDGFRDALKKLLVVHRDETLDDLLDDLLAGDRMQPALQVVVDTLLL